MNICLLLLILIPLAGAAVGGAMRSARTARNWAMFISLVTAGAAVGLLGPFDFRQDLSQVPRRERLQRSVQIELPARNVEQHTVIDQALASFRVEAIGFKVSLGIDSISLWLVVLTVLLAPLAILSSYQSIHERESEYYAWMLVLLAAMNGVFIARDLLLFYVFFELTLVPMFFIIGIWGGPERRYAAGKFFLFTFGGSIFTLAAVIYLGARYDTFDIIELMTLAQGGSSRLPPLSGTERWWVLLGLLVGFAVKVPLFPVHTWLPLAHTEAPTAGSVILAGVLLKLGTYGLLRLALPVGFIGFDLSRPLLEGYLIPRWEFWHYSITGIGVLRALAVLCIVGIIYGALVAWVQQDIKKLVAYSSVSHLGFCVLGMIALNDTGMGGSVLYMINHGLSTGALFLAVGMIYDRYHTRDINELSGLAKQMPRLAFFFILFTLSSIGLPGLNGFVSEFLTVLGAFTSQHLGIGYAVFAALGVILGAVYMLHMAARVIWGPLKTPPTSGHHETPPQPLPADIGGREIMVLAPLALAVVILGVMPNVILAPIREPLELIRTPAPRPVGRRVEIPPPALWDRALTPSPSLLGEGWADGLSQRDGAARDFFSLSSSSRLSLSMARGRMQTSVAPREDSLLRHD